MRKKLFLTSAAVLWAVTAMNSVHAATDVQKVIDETYVQPEYVLGSSLSEDQKNQTLKKPYPNIQTRAGLKVATEQWMIFSFPCCASRSSNQIQPTHTVDAKII